MALYNYTKRNRPSAAAKEAMVNIDKINGLLLTFNSRNRLDIAVGQIMRDDFVELCTRRAKRKAYGCTSKNVQRIRVSKELGQYSPEQPRDSIGCRC